MIKSFPGRSKRIVPSHPLMLDVMFKMDLKVAAAKYFFGMK